ncbi:prepilin-type N-terminal cleavage/methylation domain-containing protein [Pseudomonas stutzeri]|uniref:prepilin-type N-terminal cleavage/methylation domain-containing protein n=1 Tax=Stutzerimonas frequens TaxID=2968969 RepID=UPI001909F45E|nr:prepilin-type N-terminal cleavage/methylation domain-containing protein [Stutzerimonas frequens]MBK3916290.1 prepilin-type N-terminal cleavage/methylation domain-containing protein [Stutzerimonas frequens]
MKMFRSTLAQGGFSMLEVMVAVSIMSLIAVATTPVWINDYNEKRSNLTIEETQSILDAARVYRVEHGTWPGGTTCLSAVNALKSTSPPLLAGVTNVNPFNQTLSTSCTTTTFSVDQTVSPDWDGVVANGLASSQVLSAPSNTVRTTIGVPGTEPALDSKLSRIATGNAEMNRMQTTLLLGNNDIREVAHIDADSLNVAGNTTTGTLGVVGAASAASMAVSGTTTTGALNVTGNAVVGGTTRLNGAVTFNDTARFNDAADFREVVKLNKVVTEGASCTAAGNGAIARNAAGLTLSCQSGVWKGASSGLTTITVQTGGFRSTSRALSCPAGYKRLSCYFRGSDDKGADYNFGATPSSDNTCIFYSANFAYAYTYGYMDCFKGN